MKNIVIFEGGFGHKSMKHYHGDDTKKSKVYLSLCQNYKSKDSGGHEVEKQNWQSFTAFGNLADSIAKEEPGIMVVDAFLTTSPDKEGNFKTEMIISSYMMKRLRNGVEND